MSQFQQNKYTQMKHFITTLKGLTLLLLMFVTSNALKAQTVPTTDSIQIKIFDLDDDMRRGKLKGISVDDKKSYFGLKGEKRVPLKNNSIIKITSRQDRPISIQSKNWKKIQSLDVYMGHENDLPNDCIVEGRVFLTNKDGETQIAAATIVEIGHEKTNSTKTDILGRFALKISKKTRKLGIILHKPGITTDVNTPPDIDLTITTDAGDHTKIDVYVDDQGAGGTRKGISTTICY